MLEQRIILIHLEIDGEMLLDCILWRAASNVKEVVRCLKVHMLVIICGTVFMEWCYLCLIGL